RPPCTTLFPYTTLFRSIPVMHERNSREAGKLWFDLSKSTKHRTGDVGQINPLDLLIHIIARVNFTTKESGFTIWLYRWQRRLRTDRKSTRLNSSHVKIS